VRRAEQTTGFRPQPVPGAPQGLVSVAEPNVMSMLSARLRVVCRPAAAQAGIGHGLTTTESIFERNAEGWERFKADMKAHWIDGLLSYRSSEAVCGVSGVNCDGILQNLRVEPKRSYRTH